jgi:hypothetical protein
MQRIVTLKQGQHIKYLPFIFTERSRAKQGVAMLSSMLRSPKAVAVNIGIMRTFVRMRKLSCSNQEPADKLDELDRRVSKMKPPPPTEQRPIGFAPW